MDPRSYAQPLSVEHVARVQEFEDIHREKKDKNTILLPSSAFEPAYDYILKHLPEYLKTPEIQAFIYSHPAPALELSLGNSKKNAYTEIVIPEDVELEEKYNWLRGNRLLDEFCTQKMATDILRNIKPEMFKGIQSIHELGINYELNTAYKQSANHAHQSINTEELCVAMLTDNNEIKARVAHDAGFDSFDSFLCYIGSNLTSPSKVEGKDNFLNNILKETYAGRFKYPGVISINLSLLALGASVVGESALIQSDNILIINIFKSIMLFSGVLLSLEELASYPSKIIHEVVHYLSSEENRIGFAAIRKNNIH